MDLIATTVAVLGLYVVQIFAQETTGLRFDLKAITGNRDRAPDLSPIAGRVARAKQNLQESLPLYLGLVMLTLFQRDINDLSTDAALVFLLARVAYVPAYVSGLPWLRSLCWLVSMGALAVMAVLLF